MTMIQAYQNLQDQIAALKETLMDRLAPDLLQNPQVAEAVLRQLNGLMASVVAADGDAEAVPDGGLAQLAGIGPGAAKNLDVAQIPFGVEGYDETVTSERILAVGDLYYIYQHERAGIFDSILKLQELFKAGSVRLSSGDGAFGLYQFDRRQVLRYTKRDRIQAYRRVFGYTKASPPPGAQPNQMFHRLFQHFMEEVATFYRDKRVSEVIRSNANDPSFGSIAVVRRSGLDLRHNLKYASFGHVNVLRVEVLQLLNEAFTILGSPDIKRLFGADSAWDVVEEIMRRYLNRTITASPRSRMAITGRDVLHWLAQPHILNSSRTEFEGLLLDIADDAEEWLTSAESLSIAQPRTSGGQARSSRVLPIARATEWEQDLAL
ncbi:MAG: hypothetical protein R6W76_20990 [Caldilinea sp.]